MCFGVDLYFAHSLGFHDSFLHCLSHNILEMRFEAGVSLGLSTN